MGHVVPSERAADDRDLGPGKRDALDLAADLLAHLAQILFILPGYGHRDGKELGTPRPLKYHASDVLYRLE